MQETPSESTVKGKAQDVPSHFSYEILQEDYGKTQFYTGLPSWEVFLHVFEFLKVI